MANINDLPDEILLMIFRSNAYWQPHCEKTCRRWYSILHRLRLEKVRLRSTHQAKAFIRSIDESSDPHKYMNAVKCIVLNDINKDKEYKFTIEDVEKLLFRFPNIKEIELDNSSNLFNQFNNALCQEYVSRIPRLESFIFYMGAAKSANKFSSLVTELRKKHDNISPELLFLFPNLKIADYNDVYMPNVKLFLEILVFVPKLSSTRLKCLFNDEEGFGERYMNEISTERRTQLKKTLSQM